GGGGMTTRAAVAVITGIAGGLFGQSNRNNLWVGKDDLGCRGFSRKLMELLSQEFGREVFGLVLAHMRQLMFPAGITQRVQPAGRALFPHLQRCESKRCHL